jgi:shikimate dehydrogenase
VRWFEWREAPQADFAVIGDPIAHSLSPRMHQAAYQALDLPYRYVALRVPPGEVAAALHELAHRGCRGVNVTVPLKEEALAWCEEAEPFARRANAVNTVCLPTRKGTNTDGPGFLDTLADLGVKPGNALVLGAGGSARAVALALVGAGFSVRIYNRTKSRAEALAAELAPDAAALDEADPAGAALIVNATSVGVLKEPSQPALPVVWDRAEPKAVAYDLFYGSETSFLRAARERGLQTTDGLPMLIAQGARAFEWWLNLAAPREAMRDALI